MGLFVDSSYELFQLYSRPSKWSTYGPRYPTPLSENVLIPPDRATVSDAGTQIGPPEQPVRGYEVAQVHILIDYEELLCRRRSQYYALTDTPLRDSNGRL